MFKNKKILVTGGAGFIGSHVVEELVKEKANVFVVDSLIHKVNLIPDEISLKSNFFELDIRDYKKLSDITEQFRFDYIIHLGALANVPESIANPLEYYSVNVNGSLNILNIARLFGVERVVIASSSAVYGKTLTARQAEYHLTKTMSPYAETKLFVEEISNFYNHYLKVDNLRFFNVYGERQLSIGEGAVVPTFIKKLLNGCAPTIYGTGEQLRDFVYVKDVVEAIKMALKSPYRGDVYNVGSGLANSINALYGLIQAQIGTKIEPIRANKRPGDIDNSCASVLKAKEFLCFYPKYNLENGLKRTIEYYKKETK